MTRLRRFLHIERSRSAAPDSEPDAATARRIGGVERRADAPAGPARSGAGLERFAPPPPPPLELDRPEAGERPFTRCIACGMDHHVGAVECSQCGARLDTEETRLANDALWQERLAQRALDAAADAARASARAEAEAQAASDRRAAAEHLARAVGEGERRRLDAELGPGQDVLAAARRLFDRLLGGRWG